MQLSEAAPVSRAIYERLDAGASGFTVQVPQSFCSDGSRQRECSISELALVPGFFSQKAFQMGVESDAAERASGGPSQEYTLRFQITTEENLYHDVATGTVPNKYALPRKTTAGDFVQAVGDFFESTKPADVASLPVFIDWVDLSWEVVTEVMDTDSEGEEEQQQAAAAQEEAEPEGEAELEEEGAAAEGEEAAAEGEEAAAEEEAAPEEEAVQEEEAAPEEGEEEAAAAEEEAAPTEEAPQLERKKRETGAEPEVYLEPGTTEFFRYLVAGTSGTYYGQEYSDEEHFNALPASARTLPGVNNFAYPTSRDRGVQSTLRLRLHVAPMTAVYFSNSGALDKMGFTAKTYGERVGRRFVLKNASCEGYVVFQAENAPAPLFFNRSPSTFFCAPLRAVYLSPPVPLSVTQSNFKSNAELWQLLRGALRTLNGWTNLSVSVSYQTGDRKFAFAFPAGRVSVDLHLDSRLAERLGYGSAQTISRVSVPIAATFDDVAIDAGGLSRALVWDTVLAAVTLDNASSITASGFDGPLMATLWPDEPGIMRTSAEGTRVPVPTVQSGQASVPLTFRVWSLGKHSTVSPLDWPVHCFVAGILKGR
jgi:hypothetical protein